MNRLTFTITTAAVNRLTFTITTAAVNRLTFTITTAAVNRLTFTITTAAVFALAIIAIAHRPGSPTVVMACTGGFGGSLEQIAESDNIALVEVIAAGDGINRAPTFAPTATPSATPTTAPGTPEPTSPSPPVEPPFAASTAAVPFDVTGYGATLRVIATYAGSMPTSFEIDVETRRGVERAARQQDAGAISSCEPGQFSYRYRTGAQYLVFFGVPWEELGLTTFTRYRVEGDDLIPRDDDVYGLTMAQEVHDRFFANQPFLLYEGNPGFGELSADGVPLADVLAAIAHLRGDTTIRPPDAGSAGLKQKSESPKDRIPNALTN